MISRQWSLERPRQMRRCNPDRNPHGQCKHGRQTERRGWRGQFGKESASHRLQGHRRRRRIIDDVDVEHEEMVSLTTFIVKPVESSATELV